MLLLLNGPCHLSRGLLSSRQSGQAPGVWLGLAAASFRNFQPRKPQPPPERVKKVPDWDRLPFQRGSLLISRSLPSQGRVCKPFSHLQFSSHISMPLPGSQCPLRVSEQTPPHQAAEIDNCPESWSRPHAGLSEGDWLLLQKEYQALPFLTLRCGSPRAL